MDNDTITRIFCDVDDFCAMLERRRRAHALTPGAGRSRFPHSRLTLSEAMTIEILFHLSG